MQLLFFSDQKIPKFFSKKKSFLINGIFEGEYLGINYKSTFLLIITQKRFSNVYQIRKGRSKT